MRTKTLTSDTNSPKTDSLMSNYDEILEYLFHSLPAYHRIGAAAYKADLVNTECMMEHLGHPERGFRSIHVAGTNGKGSVSHMLASILQEAGYKTGLYTSPHLVDFRERIRINGEMIPKEKVVEYVSKNREFFERQGLSFFEMTVGMAFDYFRNEKVDVAVVEVGMGGRLDSTNVITPLLSIITNISFDHTQFLGDTLEKIAHEKAGIIKPGVPVVIGETQPETEPVFREKAKQCGSPIFFADQHYEIIENQNENFGELIIEKGDMQFDVMRDGQLYMSDMHTPLGGFYQHKNIATVFAAVEQLNSEFSILNSQFRNGISRVVANTHLHGRWEQLGSAPTLVCETAHNAAGIAEMLEKLKNMSFRRLHLIYGCVNDKDYGHIIDMLPDDAVYYFTRPSVERGLDQNTLHETAAQHGKNGEAFPNVIAALSAARLASHPDDMILVTGSIFLVADLLGELKIEN